MFSNCHRVKGGKPGLLNEGGTSVRERLLLLTPRDWGVKAK